MSAIKSPMDYLKSKKGPHTKIVWIYDHNVMEELAGIEDYLATPQGRGDEAVRQRRIELNGRLNETSEAIKFRAIRRDDYDKLVRQHEPTAEQRAEAKEQGVDLNFNPVTFPIALICACWVSPVIDKAELAAWLDTEDWNNGEIMTLFQACMEVNTSSRMVVLGKG